MANTEGKAGAGGVEGGEAAKKGGGGDIEGGHLLTQGHLFQQGFGARRQVGLPQTLGRLGVGPQQICLEVLTLNTHGIKSAHTLSVLAGFTLFLPIFWPSIQWTVAQETEDCESQNRRRSSASMPRGLIGI